MAGEGEGDAPDEFSLKLALAEKEREALGRFTGWGGGIYRAYLAAYLAQIRRLRASGGSRPLSLSWPFPRPGEEVCKGRPGSQKVHVVVTGHLLAQLFSCFFLETLNIRGGLAHQREETAPWEQRIN